MVMTPLYTLYNTSSTLRDYPLIRQLSVTQIGLVDGSSQVKWMGGSMSKPTKDSFAVNILYFVRKSAPLRQNGFKVLETVIGDTAQNSELKSQLQLDLKNGFKVQYVEYDNIDTYEEAKQIYDPVEGEDHVIIVGDFTSGQSKQFYNFLAQDNINTPMISISATAIFLGEMEEYPLFLRMAQSDSQQGHALGFLMGFFGWSKTCVLYQDNAYGKGLHDIFQKSAHSNGIEILNSLASRLIPTNFIQNENTDLVIEKFSEMRKENCRIFAFFGLFNLIKEILAIQYDLKLYGDNFLQVATEWLGSWQPNLSNPTSFFIFVEYLDFTRDGRDFPARYHRNYGRESS